MTIEEYRKKLSELTDVDFKKFNDDLGGGDKTIEERIREYVDNPQLELRICQWLVLKTEEEKITEATLTSAQAAASSAKSAKIACVISIIAVIVAIIALYASVCIR